MYRVPAFPAVRRPGSALASSRLGLGQGWPPGAQAGRGSCCRRPSGSGGRVRPSHPPSPRCPRPGAGPPQAAPPAAPRPAAALAASHPRRASSGKDRPRAGAPLPPAPPSRQRAELGGRGATERRPAGRTRARRAGGGGGGLRRARGAGAAAGGAPRALPPGHLPGSRALLAAALPLTHSSRDTRRR